MANDFYTPSGNPATSSQGSSATMRAEFSSIEDGFDKLPILAGNGGKIVAINSGASALEAIASTGTGNAVRATSPTLVTPTLGVASATSINGTTIPSSATLLTNGGALGTPSSGTLTNCTGLPASTGISGTLGVTNGGTGQTTFTNGQLLIGNSTGNTLTKATLTAGSGVSISNGTGSITISATGSGGSVTSVGQTFTGGLISVSGSPVTTSGTLALTVAGTSGGIPYFSSSSTWASSGALAANALVIGGGAGAAPSTTTTGTGVLTALGVNTGTAGAFVVNGGALGTPSSGTVTNLTGTASISINGTVGATTPNTGAFTTLSANGNFTISGSARRILGDFSNATRSNRTIFQSSTSNASTGVFFIPNGTGSNADLICCSKQDPDNTSFLLLSSNNTDGLAKIVASSVGTGTDQPLAFIAGGSERMRITTDGEVYIAGTTDQGAYNLQCNGTGVWGAGVYVNGSDARIKENVVALQSGLDVVAKLNPVTFQYKSSWSKDTSVQPGFIAQELQTALAGEVYVDGVVKDGGQYLSVSYQTLIPILTKAIQELKAEFDAYKAAHP